MRFKTRKFLDLLQENFQEVLGVDISREVCWTLYKTAIATSLQFLMAMVDEDKKEDVKLPLRGVGTWSIVFRKVRDKVAGKTTKLSKVTDLIPKLRFKASTRFHRVLVKKFCNYRVPIPRERRD